MKSYCFTIFLIAKQSLFTIILIHWLLRVKFYSDLIILSVKTLHTLVFFCKFYHYHAFQGNSQHINKTTNNEKNNDPLCKMRNSSKSCSHILIPGSWNQKQTFKQQSSVIKILIFQCLTNFYLHFFAKLSFILDKTVMEGAGEALPQPKNLSVLVEGPYFFFFFAVFFYTLLINTSDKFKAQNPNVKNLLACRLDSCPACQPISMNN